MEFRLAKQFQGEVLAMVIKLGGDGLGYYNDVFGKTVVSLHSLVHIGWSGGCLENHAADHYARVRDEVKRHGVTG